MNWLEASIRMARAHVPQAESFMLSQGALSVTLRDEGDRPVLEPGVGETPLWETVVVTGLFPGETPRDSLCAALSLLPGIEAPGRIELHELRDRAWERAWMEDFGPMRFGRGMWIVPTGCEAPDAGAVNLKLDPGLAFGSGTHPTTRLCLEYVDGLDLRGSRVVDYGCGSGVLGIAAALKGARQVFCVDHDPQALLATSGNARRNGVAGRIRTLDEGAFDVRGGDLVVANILAGTLVDLAPILCAAAGKGGKIALSGILPEQVGEVAAAYRDRLTEVDILTLDGWVLMSGTRGTDNE